MGSRVGGAAVLEHDPYFHWVARRFYAPGYEREDLVQEARIAAWLAPPGLERLAARRRLIEIVRRSRRGGRPELCAPVDVQDSGDILDLVAARERLRGILSAPLSDLEQVALGRVIRGEPYRHEKRLDNALQRARRKLAA
jgi:DNA-directed RNA polymerase specialized sigma24 family protein